jgi:quinol-cytochrome oxidoreductase complex cytochrome b subunit
MKLLKSHPILSIANSFVIDSPSPSNLSYLWNYGSLLGTCLVIQIITGVTLAMHYCPSVDYAFISVEHIPHIFLLPKGLCLTYCMANFYPPGGPPLERGGRRS